MNIKEFISNYENHPILFIGTGVSLRYLKNSYSWESLLRHILIEIGKSNEFFLDLKSKYGLEEMGKEVENIFNKELEQDRNGKFKYINDKFYYNMEQGNKVSRFKIFIATLFEELKINENKEEELSELKKIRKNISSVITTNYDKLVEELFEFKPLIGNDILLSNPYGAVYKIHGCITEPDKIIITSDDYDRFDKKYELIRAQLLSLFIHNPIIFLGYSITDKNIKSILKTIFRYIDYNSIYSNKLQKNFLLVEYDEGNINIEVQEHSIEIENDTIVKINKLKTDNFIQIYKELSELQLPISAMDIRKVQGVVKKIYEGGKINVNIVNDIEKLENSQTVLAIGDINKIRYEFQNTSEIMTNYFKIIEEDNKQLLALINKQRITKGQYFPIFAFSRINKNIEKADIYRKTQKEKMEKIVEEYKKQFIGKKIRLMKF